MPRTRFIISPKSWTKRRPYNRALWEEINKSLPKGSNELERWHLWNLHSENLLERVAEWLAEAATERWGCNTYVTVQSDWIDCHPIAKFPSPPGASKPSSACELGDLLVVVKTSRVARPICEKKGLLLQAKCVEKPQLLNRGSDGFPGNSSTHTQRNLYENNLNPFSLYTSGSNSATPIGGPYKLAAPSSTKAPFMRDYARYLLIPETLDRWFPWEKYLPYQTLWPNNRLALHGQCIHLADIMLAMGGLTSFSIGQSIERQDDWSKLVNDVINFRKTVKPKFKRFKKHNAAHLSGSGSSKKAGPVKRVINWLVNGNLNWPPIPVVSSPLYVMPPSKKPPIPNIENSPPEGMLLLRISISDSEQLQDGDKEFFA